MTNQIPFEPTAENIERIFIIFIYLFLLIGFIQYLFLAPEKITSR